MRKDEGRNQPKAEREEKEKNPPHEHEETSSDRKSGGLPDQSVEQRGARQ